MSTPEEQLEMIREALKKPRDDKPVENTGAVSGYESATVTLSSSSGQPYANTTITGGGYIVNGYNGINYPNVTAGYASVTSGSGITWNAGTTISNPWTTTTTVGELAAKDVILDGVSLKQILEERLNVMIPNPELEKEWTELKELGDKYRALEADLKEKAEIWRKLKDQS